MRRLFWIFFKEEDGLEALEVVLILAIVALVTPSIIALGVKLIRYAKDAIREALLS